MIVIIKAGTPQNQIDRLIRWLQSQGVQAHLFAGEYDTTLTLVGQTSRMNIELLAGLEIVQEVKWVSQPFQCCSREFRPQDTVISLPGSQVRIGGGSFCLIAGPLAPWKVRSKSWRSPKPSRQQAPKFCGEAPSNPGLPPTPFRGLELRASKCWWRPNGKLGFPSSQR